MRAIARTTSRVLVVALAGALGFAGLQTAAQASSTPSVSSLSANAGPYWGGRTVTVHGANFTGVRDVLFGSTSAWGVHVVSPTTLTVVSPYRDYGTVHVYVRTGAGTSRKNEAATFTFRKPKMNEPIQGGMTGEQEQQVSAKLRSQHAAVPLAAHSSRWNAAIGLTAARRAASWVGMPYSWAGGNAAGPSYGVCAHNGGDLDCHVVGFDCSGLTLYSWSPYKSMAHYAATQRSSAGSFHPAVGELMPGDLVFFSAYIPNGVGHVAIYQGNGMVVEAPQSGSAVRYSRLADLIASDGYYRGATRPLSTGRQGAAPVATYVTTSTATSGAALKIVGRNLANATSVTVGNQTIYKFLSRSAGSVLVQAPAHQAGRVAVSVSNPWGTATGATTYVAPPVLSTLSATHGPAAGGNTVTLAGSGIATVSGVAMNGKALAFQRTGTATRHTLTLTMPAHSAGRVTLTLVSRFGNSAAKTYTYDAATAPATSAKPAPRMARTAPPASPSAPSSSAPSSSAQSSSAQSSSAQSSSAPSSSAPSSSAPSSSAHPAADGQSRVTTG